MIIKKHFFTDYLRGEKPFIPVSKLIFREKGFSLRKLLNNKVKKVVQVKVVNCRYRYYFLKRKLFLP